MWGEIWSAMAWMVPFEALRQEFNLSDVRTASTSYLDVFDYYDYIQKAYANVGAMHPTATNELTSPELPPHSLVGHSIQHRLGSLAE